MRRRGRLPRLLSAGLRSLRRGLRGAGQLVSLHFLSWRLALTGLALRRRIERLEALQRTLRGRLVSLTAATELAASRGDEQDPAPDERAALLSSLARLNRALVEARTDRLALRQARIGAASSRQTEVAVGRALGEAGPDLGEGLGRFDTPSWEARHRLGAGARTRATLAALRAGAPLLEFSEELREAAETLGEVHRIGEQ